MTRDLFTGGNVQKWKRYFILFFPTRPSMTQRRVENTRVHFWTFSPLSVKFSNLNSILEIEEDFISVKLSLAPHFTMK